MTPYPKQLREFDGVSLATGPNGSKIRTTGWGDTHVVLNDTMVPLTDYTVNTLIRFIEEDYTGYSTTLDHTKHEDRFRPFDTSFGDTVVFPNGVAISGDKVPNEILDIIRVLWDNERSVDANKIGLATSTER